MTAPASKTATRVCSALAALAVAALGTLSLLHSPRATAAVAPGQVPGMDVSGHQGNVDWPAAWAAGARFAYIKATEGTGYRNPYFAQQYNGSYQVGMVRGAYHFARPDVSPGPVQADFFVAHGGSWSPDGKTLPPMLDIEYNPYGATCYGLSAGAMTDWIRAFSEQVHTRTGRWPMLYTTTDWWRTCTGDSAAFGETHPLFIARYASTAGPLPSGWRYYTMWQYSDSGGGPGDQDTFAGSMDQLVRFAGGDQPRAVAPAPPATTSPPPTTTTAPTTTAPPSTTSTTPSTTSSAPAPQAISGLVWAGQAAANPPQTLRADPKAEPLKAQPVPVSTKATKPPTTTTKKSSPTASAPVTTPPTRALANTGPRLDAARTALFGTSLVLLGLILTTLGRMFARR